MPKKTKPKKVVQVAKNKPKKEESQEAEQKSEVEQPQKSQIQSSNSSGSQESQQSIEQPKEIAVKSMQFRKRRGEKMKYLMDRKKEQEESEDQFWKDNELFGKQEDIDNDDGEDYVQSSSGRDEFDSDFLSSEKEEEEEGEDNGQEQEEKSRRPKRKAPVELKEPKPPTKKVKKPEPDKEGTNYKFIHQEYTQEQLLAQAAHTQYFNLISLKKLISLEEEKKNYLKRDHTLEPPKLVFKDSVRDGDHIQTITLVGYPGETSLFSFDPL